MVKVGFIGYGSMGSMLLDGFITSGGINPDQIIVSTKTKSKLEIVKEKWNQINIAQDNIEVAKKAKYIFICVKPLEVKNVLSEIKDFTTPETNIISIAGFVTIKNIEELISSGKVTKLIPSITSEVREGISLVCHNSRVTKEESTFIESLLAGISKVKAIEENNFELAIELTSCAPGFIAAIFQEFVTAGLRHNSNISKEDAEEMVIRTLFGTAKLFLEKNMKFEEAIARVATKGGITEEGVKVLKSRLPDVFKEMFNQTLDKRGRVKEMINKDFRS